MKILQVADIFRKAVAMGCSDIHIKPGSPPKMRKDGRLVAIPGYEGEILHPDQTGQLVNQTMTPRDRSTFDAGFQHDYAFEIDGVGRFRMNAYKARSAEACVGRLLQNKPKSLIELNVVPVVTRLASYNSGIVIVAGATGSGKSTTMAGIIDYINKARPVNIISIEDPIEILHTDAMASIAQREVGVDVEDYEKALKSALREDPDVILIGEIRDKATMRTALAAADTGHLVITTLHTNGAAETLNRIFSMFTYDEQDLIRQMLSSTLRGVVGQKLVPSVDGGRVVVNEVLTITPEVGDIILDPNRVNKDLEKIIESGIAGMQSFEQHFVHLIELGRVDLKTAKEFSDHPEYFSTAKINYPKGSNDNNLVIPNIVTPPLPHASTPPKISKPVQTSPVPPRATPPTVAPRTGQPVTAVPVRTSPYNIGTGKHPVRNPLG